MAKIIERLATLETKVKILMGLAATQLGVTVIPACWPPLASIFAALTKGL